MYAALRYFVGILPNGKKERFNHDRYPTERSHPQYKLCVGPFRTSGGADFYVEQGGPNVPHCHTVALAERGASKRRRESGTQKTYAW